MEEYPELYVPSDEIQPFLQGFFDETKWGQEQGGLYITNREWEIIIREFKMNFPRIEEPAIQGVGKERYIVREQSLFMFINNQILFLVERAMLDATDAGLVDMVCDKDGEIRFVSKKG